MALSLVISRCWTLLFLSDSARFLGLLLGLVYLAWFSIEHVVSSQVLFDVSCLLVFFFLLIFRSLKCFEVLAVDFAGFLFSGLDFLLVIRGPRRQMYDLQLTHSMLDRTCLLQKRRFALRSEEWILHIYLVKFFCCWRFICTVFFQVIFNSKLKI